MDRIARFEKVSFHQFEEDIRRSFPESFFITVDTPDIRQLYDNIKLPKRATKDSAGYDFYCPITTYLWSGETATIPTGIRVKIDEGWALKLYPRSGFGFKYRMQLDNTVGIIDGDYYNSDNEGHILVKITNDSCKDKQLTIEAGERFVQGIFEPYGVTVDDEADGVRNGGFGSTG